LGKAKRLDHGNYSGADSDIIEAKRPAYACRPTKAVAVNEGSLGSKKKSGRNKIN